ncbi:hypothetical protein MRB53_041552 [Persea americana]|nr:hypothetical protein MRB53_041552 [Persea americana]
MTNRVRSLNRNLRPSIFFSSLACWIILSHVQSRGSSDNQQWYRGQYSTPSGPPKQTSSSSVDSSPRTGSFSNSSIANHSYDSSTSYNTSPAEINSKHSLQSPEQHIGHQQQYTPQYGYQQSYQHNMNQPQPYLDVSQQHHTPTAPAPTYPYAQQPQMPPASQQYQPAAQSGYYSNAYSMAPMAGGHQITTPMSHSMASQSLPMPAMAAAGPPPGQQQFAQQQPGHQFDVTGQVAPPGMKPRVTATLWEDEGSLCFQVEAGGVCVARREDNHMINGTKLLNVAGMTRGRRDGILKSEKTRHVVKIGPMHLKGVWIPFDRALDFANKEKITEALYPLFVHNIGALLYHPTNQQRGGSSAGMPAQRATESRQSDYMRTPTGSQPPALTHHHSMSNPVGGTMQHPPPHSIAPHPQSGRPGLDRAHTFPTPPASASSLIGMASTPPQSATGSISYPQSQPYDRNVYSNPPSYSQYPAQQYQHPANIKTDMSQARGGAENEHTDTKPDGYSAHADGEQEGEYTHGSASSMIKASKSLTKAVGHVVHADSTQISPEMTHSPQQNGSGRATPRTANNYANYSTPQRGQQQLPSSNLYNVMSNDARAQNGSESYQPQSYPAPQYPAMNGIPPSSNKRMREDDNEDQYARQLSSPGGGIKRQRTDVYSSFLPSAAMASSYDSYDFERFVSLMILLWCMIYDYVS